MTLLSLFFYCLFSFTIVLAFVLYGLVVVRIFDTGLGTKVNSKIVLHHRFLASLLCSKFLCLGGNSDLGMRFACAGDTTVYAAALVLSY